MFVFKRLTDPALKRLYKFVLKRLIGRYLLDELDLDQLEVRLRAGKIELQDLALDVDAINAQLQGLPFQVADGFLGSVKVTLSYSTIMTESCIVEIDGVQLVVVPNSSVPKEAPCENKKLESTIIKEPETQVEVDSTSREGLDFVASWIEQVMSKIKISLSNVSVRFQPYANSATETTVPRNSATAALVHLDWAELTDETPVDHQHFTKDESIHQDTKNSQSYSQTGSMLFGISHKGIKFKGFRIEMLQAFPKYEDMDNHQNTISLGEWKKLPGYSTMIICNDPSRQCYMQLKLSHYDVTGAPMIDADIFIHSIQVQLQPCNLEPMSCLVDAFSQAKPNIKKNSSFDRDLYPSICQEKPEWLMNSKDEALEQVDGLPQLSFEAFKQIESMLTMYRRTHEELKMEQSMRQLEPHKVVNTSPTSLFQGRQRLFSAESVESGGLSDMEDDFFECETGLEDSMHSTYFPTTENNMASSMYVSANLKHSIHAPARKLECRIKAHILEVNVDLLYQDLPRDFEADENLKLNQICWLQMRVSTMHDVSEKERLRILWKDALFSWISFSLHSTVSFTLGTCTLSEYISRRFSECSSHSDSETNEEIDSEDPASLLIEVPFLRFHNSLPPDRPSASTTDVSMKLRLEYEIDGEANPTTNVQNPKKLISSMFRFETLPILIEWDMTILNRLSPYFNESENNEQANPPKKFCSSEYGIEVLTKSIAFNIRFPFVKSDLIRFGPSSVRGLCEDQIIVKMTDMKLVTGRRTDESKSKGKESDDLEDISWMKEFLVEFHNIEVSLQRPRGGNPRAKDTTTHCLLEGNSSDSNTCSIRFCLQQPSVDDLTRSFKTCTPSQDTGDTHFSMVGEGDVHEGATTLNQPDDIEGTEMIMNDGSRALRSAKEFMKNSQDSSTYFLKIYLVYTVGEFYKETYDRLFLLIDALLSLNPPPIFEEVSDDMIPTRPSYMSLHLTVDEGTLEFHDANPENLDTPIASEDYQNLDRLSYKLSFEGFEVYQVSQWLGQQKSRIHVLAQDVTLFEIKKKNDTLGTRIIETIPVLYKKSWESSLSDSFGGSFHPILSIFADISDVSPEMREMVLSITFSQLTLRYDVESSWLFRFLEIVMIQYPPYVVPIDTPFQDEESLSRIMLEQEPVTKLPMEERTIFTKLFVTCYQGVIDYSPTDLLSRVLICLGSIHVSSNLVTGAKMQGFKFLLQDIQLYLSACRDQYEEENQALCGFSKLSDEELSTLRVDARQSPQKVKRRRRSGRIANSLQEYLEQKGFVQLALLDSADVFLRNWYPDEETNVSQEQAEFHVDRPPDTAIEVCLGLLQLFTCFDSCDTLFELILTWWSQYSVPLEPQDTSAYVGVDKVKDSNPPTVSLFPESSNTSERIKKSEIEEFGSKETQPYIESVSTEFLSIDGGTRTTSLNSSKKLSNRVSVLDEVEENAFGFQSAHGKGYTQDQNLRLFTDTEARVWRTMHNENKNTVDISIESRSFGELNMSKDDELTASELRAKYSGNTAASSGVKFIEDYYALDPKNVVENSNSSLDVMSPWFKAVSELDRKGPMTKDVNQDDSESQDDQVARWLPADLSSIAQSSTLNEPEPVFEAVDEPDEFKSFLGLEKEKPNDEDTIEEEMTSSILPQSENTSSWWSYGGPAEQEFELKDMDSITRNNGFPRAQIDDDTELSAFPRFEHSELEPGAENTMSMSFIGSGEDLGTEIELDFNIDDALQSKLTNMLNVDEEEEEEDDDGSLPPPMSGSRSSLRSASSQSLENIESRALLGFGEKNSEEFDTLDRFENGNNNPSSHSTVPSISEEDVFEENSKQWVGIPNKESSSSVHQSARWFHSHYGDGVDESPIRIFPHHVEIPISGSAAALSFGEREEAFALRSVSNHPPDADGTPQTRPHRLSHILLRDFNLRWRLFGGFDWQLEGRDTKESTKSYTTNDVRKDSNEKEDNYINKRSKKTEKLLDSLLDNYIPTSSDGAKTEGDKSSEPSPKPPKRRVSRNGRKTEQMIEVLVHHIKVRVDNYADEEHQPLASSTVVCVDDFEVLDYISTSQIRKMVCYWKSDVQHPRENGMGMAHVHLMAVRPGPNLCEEHRLRVRLLPLRVNLDQEVIEFLRDFFCPNIHNNENEELGRTRSGSVKSSPQKFDGALSPSNQHKIQETDVNVGAWFFQSCDVKTCKIKIDYHPERLNYKALRDGDYFEVINLFDLEGMELTLRQVKVSGLDGWGAVGEAIVMSWVNDISRHQIHKCVASVSMPPIRSFANIGSGAADLILLPMEQYNRDRRLVKGLKRGAKSFLRTITIETLNTASKVARGTQALLEHAGDVVVGDMNTRRRSSRSQARERNKGRNVRYGNGHARYLASQPADTRDGLNQAYASLTREIQTAAKTIVAIPWIEYQKTGPQGYVKSVIRAVPVAVIRPMIGATEAISRALIGVRNAVDPEIKEDLENKFKDLTT